jgi:tetratricopeptide (TPR) repeat protein
MFMDENRQRWWADALRSLIHGIAYVCLGLTFQSLPSGAVGSDASAYERTILEIQKQIELGNFGEAGTLVATAARRYPHDGGVENLLGVIEIEQGHTAAATKAFSDAIIDNPRLAGAYLNLSRIKMQFAATDPAVRTEALRLSLRVLQLDPASDEARYQAATILFWNKDYRPSLEHLQKLSVEGRAKIGAEGLICADFAALGHRQETNEAAGALVANPDLTEQDVDTCVRALRAAKRADLIETLLNAAARRQALSAGGLRVLGLAQEAEGELQIARVTLESAFAANSKSVEILEDLTRIANAANDHEGALGYLAHARDLQPGNAALPYEFGVICVRMGLYAEARKAIADALRLDPDNGEYNLGMGLVVSFSEDPSRALPYLTRYHSLHPKDPEGLLALGAANFRAKDYDAALHWLRQSVASEKTAADAHFYLGRIALQEGHLDEATTELKQSLALRPDQPDTLAELGQICMQLRDFAQSAAYFDRALQKDHDNYAANFGLLQLYARTGDSRLEQQSHRFDEIKNIKEERDRQMIRVIEIRPTGLSNEPN